MPVAVDWTRAMTASVIPSSPSKTTQEAPTTDALALNHRKRRKAKGKEIEEEAWSWKFLTDSSASRVPPIFTKDGSYFFSAAGISVKIHSVATGDVVSTLTPPPNSVLAGSGTSQTMDIITAVLLNPHNPFQLITGSQDGYIRTWDFLDASLLQTIRVLQPILHLTAHERFRDYVFAAVSRSTKKKTKGGIDTAEDNAHVLRISLIPKADTTGSAVRISSEITNVGKTRSTSGLAVSGSGAWLVATAGHKAYVCQTGDLKAGFTKYVSPERLTCLAVHPSEEYFVTGDATGCIRLWYCLNDSSTKKIAGVEKTAQTTTLHWHAHAVSSLHFTANGAYLLSGGEEAVLVIWQLHTGKKEYVPRVGSPILHIALLSTSGEEEYLLSLADASFVFIRSSTLKISRSIARIKLDPAISHDRPSTSQPVPLAVHPLSSTLILPSSHPSSLQTFAPSSSKLVSELEISSSNRVSRRDDKPLQPVRVERVALSDSGEWMATVDTREAEDPPRPEVYMKIWQWDRKTGFWILNTRVDRPHGATRISGIAFRPGPRSQEDLLLATVGADGNIKTWRIRSVKTKSDGVEEFWVARSSLRFRAEIPSDLSWSPDGSLLAVLVGGHVAIYESNSNTLCQVLTCPDCPLTSTLQFLGASGRYVLVSGPQDVLLWDLVFQMLRWRHRSPVVITQVIVHPSEEQFAVLEQDQSADAPSTRAFVFQAGSFTPVATRTLPFRLRSAVSIPIGFLPTDPSGFALVGITEQWSVVMIGDYVQLQEEEVNSAHGILRDATVRKPSLLQDIFGFSVFTDPTTVPSPSREPIQAHQWNGKGVKEIFDAPAHLLPPLDYLFDSVMDSFLTAQPEEHDAQSEHVNEDDEMDFDQPSDEDDLPAKGGATLDRVVDKQEMHGFVELFMNHAVKAPALRPPPVQVNGIVKSNGIPPHLNGPPRVTPKHTPKAKPNGVSPTSTRPLPDASPLLTAGKKRKNPLS